MHFVYLGLALGLFMFMLIFLFCGKRREYLFCKIGQPSITMEGRKLCGCEEKKESGTCLVSAL